MAEKLSLTETTDYLFNINYWSDEYDTTEEKRLNIIEELEKEYPWNDIFNSWNNYLRTKCQTADDVVNFMNLFFAYNGQKEIIPEPIDFAAYIYYRLGDKIKEDEAQTMADSIIIPILMHSGLISKYDTCYAPESDPRIAAAVKELQSSNN